MDETNKSNNQVCHPKLDTRTSVLRPSGSKIQEEEENKEDWWGDVKTFRIFLIFFLQVTKVTLEKTSIKNKSFCLDIVQKWP